MYVDIIWSVLHSEATQAAGLLVVDVLLIANLLELLSSEEPACAAVCWALLACKRRWPTSLNLADVLGIGTAVSSGNTLTCAT